MRVKFLSVVLGLSMIALASPAHANLDAKAKIRKDKDVRVIEAVHVYKLVVIAPIMVKYDFTGAAEAQALTNQINKKNYDGPVPGTGPGEQPAVDEAPCYGCDLDYTAGAQEFVGFAWDKEARIENSILNNSGIVGVNQDVGNMVNQANNVAFAFSTASDSITHAQAHSEQVNKRNEHILIELLPRTGGGVLVEPLQPTLRANIINSVNTNTGIVGVNQNVGSMNNQANTLALAVGTGASVALSESDLGQVNAKNSVTEFETVKADLISNSVNGNQGVVQVNQSTGNFNNQASSVAAGFLTSTVVLTVPGAP